MFILSDLSIKLSLPHNNKFSFPNALTVYGLIHRNIEADGKRWEKLTVIFKDSEGVAHKLENDNWRSKHFISETYDGIGTGEWVPLAGHGDSPQIDGDYYQYRPLHDAAITIGRIAAGLGPDIEVRLEDVAGAVTALEAIADLTKARSGPTTMLNGQEGSTPQKHKTLAPNSLKFDISAIKPKATNTWRSKWLSREEASMPQGPL